MKSLSHVRLLAIPWTAAYQAPPSMGFSRQEYWSGVPLPSPNGHSTCKLKRAGDRKLDSLESCSRGERKKINNCIIADDDLKGK